MLISTIIFIGTVILAQGTDSPTQKSEPNDKYIDELSNTTKIQEWSFKHKLLKSCFILDIKEDQYEMFPNKTIYVLIFNKTYEVEHYLLIGKNIRICAPSESFEKDLPGSSSSAMAIEYFTILDVAVCMICSLWNLIIFAIVPDLHNLPGCNMASLCLSMFINCVIILSWNNISASKNSVACTAVAVLGLFFFLGSFLWMLVMSFDVYLSILNATENFKVSKKGFKLKLYLYNSLFCWGTALVLTTAAWISDNVEGIHESYKPRFQENCWFKNRFPLMLFFAFPMLTIILSNSILFGISAYNIYSNRMKSGICNKRVNFWGEYLTYIRLAIMMNVTWTTYLIAFIYDVSWSAYLCKFINTFQVCFLSIGFTFTPKMKKYFKSNLWNRSKASNQNSGFQIFVLLPNSIKKDLSNTLENKDNLTLLIP